MTLLAAATGGLLVGLAYFTALWLSVRRLASGAWGAGHMAAGAGLRVLLAAAAFYGFSRLGAGAAATALIGFLAARWLWTGWPIKNYK